CAAGQGYDFDHPDCADQCSAQQCPECDREQEKLEYVARLAAALDYLEGFENPEEALGTKYEEYHVCAENSDVPEMLDCLNCAGEYGYDFGHPDCADICAPAECPPCASTLEEIEMLKWL